VLQKQQHSNLSGTAVTHDQISSCHSGTATVTVNVCQACTGPSGSHCTIRNHIAGAYDLFTLGY
jgi:hypothetical protein